MVDWTGALTLSFLGRKISMAEYHFPVPGSKDEGQIVLFVRKHWAAFLGQGILILFLLIFPAILILLIYSRDSNIFSGLIRNFLVLGLSTYYLVILTFAFTAWLSFYYDIYIVTINSIVDITQQGFFGRKISQLSLLRVQDVNSSIQGFFATFFAYGNVLVETAGEQSQTFLLETIPNPQEVASKIQQLHNQLIEIEGRHHQVLEGEGALAPGKIIGSGLHEHPEQNLPENKEEAQTAYQKMLREQVVSKPEIEPEKKIENSEQKGEIDKNHLDQGGSIDLK